MSNQEVELSRTVSSVDVISSKDRPASRVSIELGPAAVTYFTEEELSHEEDELEATAESIVDTTILQAVCYLNQVGVLAEKAHFNASDGEEEETPLDGDELRMVIRNMADMDSADPNKNDIPHPRLNLQPKPTGGRGGHSTTPFQYRQPYGPAVGGEGGVVRKAQDRGHNSAKPDRLVVAEKELRADLASFTADPAPNINWPTNGEFTQDKGLESIDEYIITWQRSTKWGYCIDFVQRQPTQYGDKYVYQVKWSIPTKEMPIPRVTASVYFTMHVSRVQPEDAQVQVTFQMETNRMVHVPGQSRFCEKWLQDIIDSKMILIHTLSAASKKA